MNTFARLPQEVGRTTSSFPRLVAAVLLFVGWPALPGMAAVAPGANALLAPEVQPRLKLSPKQRQQIQPIVRATAKTFNETQSAKRDSPNLKAELDRIRQAAQDEALALLTPVQKAIWIELADRNSPSKSGVPRREAETNRQDELAARSLIIPSIQQMRNPPSPDAFGPTTSIRRTRRQSPRGDGYAVLTDHTDPVALAALKRLAEFRHGSVVTTPSLGELHQSPDEFARLTETLRGLRLRFVAIAPRTESYRENMHLAVLKLLSSLSPEAGLDVFPRYLIGSDVATLAALVDRTIAYKPMTRDQLRPVSIGTIEDNGVTRYRSYQKAKVLQKMFAEQGTDSPALIVVTNPALTGREDFPKLGTTAGEIAMLPGSRREAFRNFSEPALQALEGRNVMFMFGHGLPDKLCGTSVSAFAPVDFTNDLVFCGSCMSASPVHADRVNLEEHAATKRFGSLAVEKGAVMVLGHMGLCGGFPEVYPLAEHVLEGLPVGEAYQRVMNAIIGSRPLPGYYDQPTSRQNTPNDGANLLLLILWADPALVAITAN